MVVVIARQRFENTIENPLFAPTDRSVGGSFFSGETLMFTIFAICGTPSAQKTRVGKSNAMKRFSTTATALPPSVLGPVGKAWDEVSASSAASIQRCRDCSSSTAQKAGDASGGIVAAA